ncbi:hypothetical protein FRC10_003317 [Ceratobasidium sp. 414]|nr:hypothetical protein FRC10_003317 [Ceratobasidium sp. 414]
MTNPSPNVPSEPPTAHPPDLNLRQRLVEATKLATEHEPFDWQVDVAEALCNKRDVMCLASTGSGKTLPIVMPCFVDPRALVWVVSPLNYLEQQQERVFNNWGVPTCSVNATTSYPGLHKDILSGKYRVIITSPEQLLDHNKLRPILIQLGAENWNNIVVIDECHCICIWCEDFRKTYGLLGTIRTFLCPGTPFCAATATATASMQKQVRSSLRFNDDYLFINQGWWKPNLSWHVYYMKGSDSSIAEITRMFPKDLAATSVIPMSIIFVDQRNLAFQIYRVLRDFLPPELAGRVEVYHALQSTIAKEQAAKRFANGMVRILICTEALTMRGGRGGRDKTIECRVVLMVEASRHKAALAQLTKHVKQADIKKEEDVPVDLDGLEANQAIGVDEIEAMERVPVGGQGEGQEESEATDKALRIVSAKHGKEDDEFLEKFYAPSDGCRTLVLDMAFCSPPHPPCISVNGCDNCIRRRIKQLESKRANQAHQSQDPVKQEPLDDLDALGETADGLRALLVEPQAVEKPPRATVRNKYRRKADREQLEEVLKLWRSSTYDADCKRFGIHADYIITDMAIQVISRLQPPVTLGSLSKTSPRWPEKAFTRWGQSLIAIVEDFDSPKSVTDRSRADTQLKQELQAKKGPKQSKNEPKKAVKTTKSKKRPATSEAAAPKTKKPRTQVADSATSAGASSPSQAALARLTQPATAVQPSVCAQPMETGAANLFRLCGII